MFSLSAGLTNKSNTEFSSGLNSITLARSSTFGLNIYVVSSILTVPTTNRFSGYLSKPGYPSKTNFKSGVSI